MSNSYFWSGFLVLLVMFVCVLNALLDIRGELHRLNNHMDAEKRASRHERLFGKREP
jgi:hypothetical protein